MKTGIIRRKLGEHFEVLPQIEEVSEGRKYIFEGTEIILKEISVDINFPKRKMEYNEVYEIMQKAEILKEIEELAKEVEEKGLEQKLAKVAERFKKEGYLVKENFEEGVAEVRYEIGKTGTGNYANFPIKVEDLEKIKEEIFGPFITKNRKKIMKIIIEEL